MCWIRRLNSCDVRQMYRPTFSDTRSSKHLRRQTMPQQMMVKQTARPTNPTAITATTANPQTIHEKANMQTDHYCNNNDDQLNTIPYHFNWCATSRVYILTLHTCIDNSFIKNMTERINLTMKKWTKCNQKKLKACTLYPSTYIKNVSGEVTPYRFCLIILHYWTHVMMMD